FIDDALLKRSFQKLTDPQVYEHFIRPKGLCGDNSKNRNDNNWYLKPLELNMSLELYNYATVDERNSEYTFQFFLDLEWCDERLILQNKSELFPIFIKTDEDHMNTFLSKNKISNFKHEYQFEGGQYYIERLWHPSIFVSNNEQPGSIDYDGQSPNMARIDLDSGRIFLRKRKMLVINCLMDFSLFPFDRQHCSVHFESNVENSQKLVMRWREMLLNEDEANAQKLASKESSMWSLLFWASSKSTELNGSSNSVIKSHGSFRTVGFELVDINLSNSVVSGLSGVNFSRCSFDFTLQRQFIHHVLINYLPSTLIVTVSMTTFWLPIDSSPTRVLMAATTMLTMVTNFKLSRELLPTVTYLNVLDIWNLVCVTFIALSIIEYAVVSFIINTPKRQTTMHRIRKRSEKYRRHHQGSIRELQVSQTPQPSSNSSKDVKRSSYYVWFLGSKESKGLRGDEYVTPVLNYLLDGECGGINGGGGGDAQPLVEPSKVTLQVSSKGLKIIQILTVPRKSCQKLSADQQSALFFAKQQQQQSKGGPPFGDSASAAAASSMLKSEQVKHHIPHNSITWVYQEEDVVCAILLLYNPLTRCPVHVHAYRCDSVETADSLRGQLQALVSRPENQKKFRDIESRLPGKKKHSTQHGISPSSAAHFKQQQQQHSGKQSKQSRGGKSKPFEEEEGEEEGELAAGATAALYDSLAAELRAKLGNPKMGKENVAKRQSTTTMFPLTRSESSGKSSSGIGSEEALSSEINQTTKKLDFYGGRGDCYNDDHEQLDYHHQQQHSDQPQSFIDYDRHRGSRGSHQKRTSQNRYLFGGSKPEKSQPYSLPMNNAYSSEEEEEENSGDDDDEEGNFDHRRCDHHSLEVDAEDIEEDMALPFAPFPLGEEEDHFANRSKAKKCAGNLAPSSSRAHHQQLGRSSGNLVALDYSGPTSLANYHFHNGGSAEGGPYLFFFFCGQNSRWSSGGGGGAAQQQQYNGQPPLSAYSKNCRSSGNGFQQQQHQHPLGYDHELAMRKKLEQPYSRYSYIDVEHSRAERFHYVPPPPPAAMRR
ncbi:hypothetical protein TYRP_020066, partial [Tyrophagus putrescentiae]